MSSPQIPDRRPRAALIFLAYSLICQLTAASAGVLAWECCSSILLAIAAASAAAACVSVFLALPLPWILLNIFLPLGAATALAVEVPNGMFFAIFALLACTYIPAFWTRVPYYPTQRAAYASLLAELPTDSPFSFIDLGCGFGDLVSFLHRQRPHGKFVGVEIGPLPFLVAKLRSLGRRNVEIRFRSLWRVDLSAHDFVYAFLSPAPMDKLWTKVVAEMLPGSVFISNSFEAPAEPAEVISLRDPRRSSLYLYRMAARLDGPHHERAPSGQTA